MKTTKLMVASLIKMMTRPAARENKEMVLTENLPMATKMFVMQNFPRLSIAYAVKRSSNKGTMYELNLNDGTDILLNEDGKMSMLKCYAECVPGTMVPEYIFSLMKAHYPGSQVVKIEKSGNGSRFTLTNHVVLHMNQAMKTA